MKNKIKLTFLAVAFGIIATSVQAATYNSDLLIGFTAGVGNDLIYDLGQESSLTNGEKWNLNSLLTSYTLSTVNWGVIGSTNSPKVAFATYDGNAINGSQAWGNLNNPAVALYGYFATAGAGQSASMAYNDVTDNSWYEQTISGPLGTSYVNENGNPNVVGLTSNSFYQYLDNGSTPTQLGSFSLAANGVVTYNVLSSAPPAPRIVSITRLGNTSTIFFTTTNGTFTYSLHYTNSTGLITLSANWPTNSTTLVGNGFTNSLQDVTTDANRFYRVSAH